MINVEKVRNSRFVVAVALDQVALVGRPLVVADRLVDEPVDSILESIVWRSVVCISTPAECYCEDYCKE